MDSMTNPKTSPFQNDTTTHSAAAEQTRRSIDEAHASATDLAVHGKDALRSGTARVREVFGHTTDQAAQYVRAKPLKSLLMALAAGAAIAKLSGVIGKRHS